METTQKLSNQNLLRMKDTGSLNVVSCCCLRMCSSSIRMRMCS